MSGIKKRKEACLKLIRQSLLSNWLKIDPNQKFCWTKYLSRLVDEMWVEETPQPLVSQESEASKSRCWSVPPGPIKQQTRVGFRL